MLGDSLPDGVYRIAVAPWFVEVPEDVEFSVGEFLLERLVVLPK
jgi:hypothetical protein